VKLDLDLVGQGERHLDAYERLLMDVVRGNQTLFVRRDELNAAWKWVEPVLKTWDALDRPPDTYVPGSTGPASARELVGKDGNRWIEDI
ncbi:MAG TPA: glucose-6-phosphate dehydrogenase, partial [Gammaproteobacteria bacterium]|nr:glucose-6-phosphate dehydrogenase [Gammaproteobacteria bacterium]